VENQPLQKINIIPVIVSISDSRVFPAAYRAMGGKIRKIPFIFLDQLSIFG